VVDNTGNNFVIELDPTAKQARLIVPKKLATGRAALDLDSTDRLAADESHPAYQFGGPRACRWRWR